MQTLNQPVTPAYTDLSIPERRQAWADEALSNQNKQCYFYNKLMDISGSTQYCYMGLGIQTAINLGLPEGFEYVQEGPALIAKTERIFSTCAKFYGLNGPDLTELVVANDIGRADFPALNRQMLAAPVFSEILDMDIPDIEALFWKNQIDKVNLLPLV